MQIEITGGTERMIEAISASGKFASVEEFVDAMAKREHQTTKVFNVSETYAAQSSVAGSSGWDDVEMDVYNDYNAQRVRN